MSIDPTVSEFFFRSSIKKYFIDSLVSIEGLIVIFDQTILYENVQSYDVDQWVVVNFGVFARDLLSTNILDINCCTRMDAEGVQLSKLTDTVVGYLTDISTTDTMRRIALYDTSATDPTLWTTVGSMLVHDFRESPQQSTPDHTKTKNIITALKWGAVI